MNMSRRVDDINLLVLDDHLRKRKQHLFFVGAGGEIGCWWEMCLLCTSPHGATVGPRTCRKIEWRSEEAQTAVKAAMAMAMESKRE